MVTSKTRGQKRKFKILSDQIDKIEPFKNTDVECEHFHVPCGLWLSKMKTSGKIKSAFCKKWIQKAEEFSGEKPEGLSFCKVVAAITYPDILESQIIIFYDESYYESFWDRKGPYQIWTSLDSSRSFAKERGIVTELPEVGYIEEINDGDSYTKTQIWFYGECL